MQISLSLLSLSLFVWFLFPVNSTSCFTVYFGFVLVTWCSFSYCFNNNNNKKIFLICVKKGRVVKRASSPIMRDVSCFFVVWSVLTEMLAWECLSSRQSFVCNTCVMYQITFLRLLWKSYHLRMHDTWKRINRRCCCCCRTGRAYRWLDEEMHFQNDNCKVWQASPKKLSTFLMGGTDVGLTSVGF